MSKVYDYHLEMEELDRDLEWHEFLNFLDQEQEVEFLQMEDVEEVKAKEFARKLMEAV